MRRNRLLLQASVVTLLGLAAHLTRPDSAASATASANLCNTESTCSGACTWAGTCGEGCSYYCEAPPSRCGETSYFQICYLPM
jgi:hypothetical protein